MYMKLKKVIFLILLFFVFLPFIVKAESCDLSKISIDSVTIKDKTDNVMEIEEPSIEGNNLKVDLKMFEVNDSIEYKLLLKNDSSEDYELDDKSFNTNSEYIKYTLNTDDNNLIVKSGESKEVYLKIQYKNEVPRTVFSDGKYNDNKNIVLNLSNSEVVNPKTGDNNYALILILLLCVGVAVYFLVSQKRIDSLMIIILGLLIVIPISTHALCKIEVKIDSKVEIEEVGYSVNYIIQETIKTSEKSNYDIFDYSNYGIEIPSCMTIEGKDGYEVCKIIYSKKMYAPGDSVTVPNEITYHIFNGEGELIENIVPLNHSLQHDIWYYSFDESKVTSEKKDLSFMLGYSKILNNYDDINTMNFTGNINNQWDSTLWPKIDVYAPNSFTMPSHDMILELNFSAYGYNPDLPSK